MPKARRKRKHQVEEDLVEGNLEDVPEKPAGENLIDFEKIILASKIIPRGGEGTDSPDTWIVGNSIPYWGGARARDTGKVNLRTSCELGWYEIIQCGDVEKLIKKRTHPEESPLYYVTIEDTFDVIKRAHIATGHGGRDHMINELQRKYANITTKALEHFKSLCAECQKKRKRPMTKGVVVRPILTKVEARLI
ncbi:KRAB-A domain-containing protein 2-like [Mya arenaria]|uniref:KRAB-A domain-containing protein 2-like n=1 Tax=Mya arenaria TaxID=6604 RepID=UPI0022DFD648|nr:KRAB-A domain-containing protein 2-like [Mya arenaria]